MRNNSISRSLWWAFLAGVILCGLSGCSGGSGTTQDEGTRNVTVASFATTAPAPVALSTTSITGAGGTITSPEVANLKIDVPAGAVNEAVTFSVAKVQINDSTGLPEGVEVGSTMFVISTSGSAAWNEAQLFALPVKVTLPIDNVDNIDGWYFYSYNADGKLEALGFDSIDKVNKTITFEVRTFGATPAGGTKADASPASLLHSAYVAIGIANIWDAWLSGGKDVDSGFRPSRDGWYIPNYGAFYKASRGGNCMGMCTWANYWFRKQGSGFRSHYRDVQNTATWVDDGTAIELASRAHGAESAIWNEYSSRELGTQRATSRDVAMGYIGSIYVTGVPALVGMYQAVNSPEGLQLTAGHAISIYRAEITASGECTLHVYDPNFPNSDTRSIRYKDGTGFYIYNGGPSASQPGYSYNYFKQFGYSLAVSDTVFDALKESADQGFSNDTVFPTITLTSITGKKLGGDVLDTKSTNDNSEETYETEDNAIVIKGTVLGGNAQTEGSVVDNINVIVTDNAYSASVNNAAGSGDGTFEIVVPLKNGNNEVVFLASKEGSYSHWAAFKRIVVKSTASPSSMTITLNWGQSDSDVDLYVKEPAFDGRTGDTVYYSNREGVSSTHPYLDFDNTDGYGPEHYIGKWGMTTLSSDGSSNPKGLYGTYTVGVHYYSDNDGDTEKDQPITWGVNWRYLAYCPGGCENPETDGVWIEGSRSGSLSAANSGTDGSLGSGPEWSETWNITYDDPEDFNFTAPESHEVMLP